MVARSQKTLRIRMDVDDFAFLSRLAAANKEDLSKAVRELVRQGRLMLAVEQYRAGRVSLGRAAEIAGLSVSETMDVLARYGVEANLEEHDYLEGIRMLAKRS